MSESQRLGMASDLCSEIEYGLNALNAVHSVMVDGPTAAETFTGGLYCVYTYLNDKVKALSHLLEDGRNTSYE